MRLTTPLLIVAALVAGGCATSDDLDRGLGTTEGYVYEPLPGDSGPVYADSDGSSYYAPGYYGPGGPAVVDSSFYYGSYYNLDGYYPGYYRRPYYTRGYYDNDYRYRLDRGEYRDSVDRRIRERDRDQQNNNVRRNDVVIRDNSRSRDASRDGSNDTRERNRDQQNDAVRREPNRREPSRSDNSRGDASRDRRSEGPSQPSREPNTRDVRSTERSRQDAPPPGRDRGGSGPRNSRGS